MAIKDEYEVARLFTDGEMDRALARHFTSNFRIRYHMAPPFMTRPDKVTGRIRKWSFGQWIRPAYALLAAMRKWRGTWFDPFGRSADRRHERQMIRDYEALIFGLLAELDTGNLAAITEIARLHADIRGYGYVKAASIAKVKAREADLLAALRASLKRAA
jgi:indolepyruvate ferredoxin oxidoreductase